MIYDPIQTPMMSLPQNREKKFKCVVNKVESKNIVVTQMSEYLFPYPTIIPPIGPPMVAPRGTSEEITELNKSLFEIQNSSLRTYWSCKILVTVLKFVKLTPRLKNPNHTVSVYHII